MKKMLFAGIVASVLMAGCVAYAQPEAVVVAPDTVVSTDVVVFEPDVIIGGYYVGFFRPGFGYWTGYGWDINFYAYGHPGWGHYYRGAPRSAWGAYHSGPHFHGHAAVHGPVRGGGHHRR